MELVVVIAIFGLVLTAAYQVLLTTIQSEETINRKTLSGKIGDSILGLIRRDVQGLIWRGLGKSVFLGEDFGSDDSAADEIEFLTTATVPTAPDDEYDQWSEGLASVGYVLKVGQEDYGTLFRRVRWALDDDTPLTGGRYFPIYERVQSISFEYLDDDGQTVDWVVTWDSEERIEGDNLDLIESNEEPEESEEEAGTPSSTTSAATDEEATDETVRVLAVPRAVRVVLRVYLGDESGLMLDPDDQPIIEEYSTVIAILASEDVYLDPELIGTTDSGEEASGPGSTDTGSSGTGSSPRSQ